MDSQSKIDILKSKIGTALFRERLILFTAGLAGTVAVVLLSGIILSLVAGMVILPVWVKAVLLVLSAGAGLWAFWKLAFQKIMTGSLEATALKLEKKFPDLKGRLIAALQFSRPDSHAYAGYSNELMEETLVQAYERASGHNFNEILSAYPIWKNARTLGITVALALALLFVFPGLFSYSYEVYSHPGEVIAPPLGYTLFEYPGSKVAIKYRDVDLGGILTGGSFPEEAVVYYRFAGGTWQKTPLELKSFPRHKIDTGDSLLFYTTVRQVRRSLDYYIKAGRLTTEMAHIDVVDRPRVTGIRLSLFYPQYTGLPPQVIDENDGNITAVFGSRATMQVETNGPLQKADMVFSDSSRSSFKISGQTAEQSLKIEESKSYYIHLVDMQNEVNPDPIEYYITAVPDEYPVIDVLSPGMDMNLDEEMEVPILLRISDDYGFKSLLLKYKIVARGEMGGENIAVLHFSDNIKTEGEVKFSWDVEPLGLMPSDYIIYQFELADNDAISGPKVTGTRTYIARLPSLEEIIAQTEAEQSEVINDAESYLKAHRDLSERLQKVARNLEQQSDRGSQKMDWQQQKELEEIARSNEKIAEQMKETARKLDDAIKEMEKNRMASTDILEKLNEIKKLFDEVATPEMRQAQLELMEALKNMDQQQLDQAMKDFEMSQQELMQRLDRTIALLKKMQIEQKVNAMTQMARELLEKQEKMNAGTESSKSEDLPSLASEEKKLSRELEGLKEQAREMRQMLDQFAYVKADDADKFCSAVEKTDAGQNMNNMAENLNQQKKGDALNEGRQAASKLLSLLDQMQQGQSSMCQGGGQEAAEDMRKAIDDINYLAEKQEGLINGVDKVMNNSEVLRDYAAQQQIIKESVTGLQKRLEELGKQSPFVAAEMGNVVNAVIGNMNLAIENFSERRRPQGMNAQKEALTNLNRAAVRMLDALQNQKDCNKGGSSCNKPSLSMNSLCDKQQQLNQQTQSMCNKPGQMGANDPDALRRLAGEQNSIRKTLGELADEFGDSKEVLGRLDAIADEMKEVADALSSGEVGPETQEKQLRILSRMLDATKTLQRKDYTDKRRATAAQDVFRLPPAALSGSQIEGGLDIEDKLRRFMNEFYPAEYEQHIKAYFRALMEKSNLNMVQPSDDKK
jgi:hypothetical protein